MAPLSPGKLKELTRKWMAGTLTASESKLLEDWYGREAPEQIEWASKDVDEEALKERLFSNISRGIQPVGRIVPLWRRRLIAWSVAAAILVSFGLGAWFFIKYQHGDQHIASIRKNDVPPGSNKATLTLASGQKIILTKGLNGKLAQQGQTQIIVDKDHNVAYTAKHNDTEISYNTLSTARGEQSPYALILADGTKVWLNAESSITFPTAFNGKERLVKMSGEAFFEVAHNSKQPFKVQTAKQIIEDIGTQFDVNAYNDEPASKTTLVEGAVSVTGSEQKTVVLKPGEQALTAGNELKVVQGNVVDAVAWKNGEFRFNDDDMQTIMRQLARWYDIDVSYQGAVTKEVFYAKLSKQRDISAILNVLERTKGIHFKIEGRRVTVIE